MNSRFQFSKLAKDWWIYLFLGDVVNEDAGVGAAVEGRADGLELFLAGGVPDLEDNLFVIEGDFVWEEVGADGDPVLVREFAFHVANDEGGFADAD